MGFQHWLQLIALQVDIMDGVHINSNPTGYLLWLWMNIWSGVQFAVFYNQNSGYRRFLGMLFTNSATTSMMMGPTPPGMSTYKYPRLWIF